MEREELVSLIQRAIQAEWEGNRFYMHAAGAAKDAKAKKMFEQLAKDELYHVEVIENLYEDLLPGSSRESVQGFPIFGKEAEEMAGEVSDFTNEFEVLQKAIEDEIRAKEFYGETATTFELGPGRDVFLDLMEMEAGHIRLLQAELDFLKKSGFYFNHMEFTVEGERD